jgi:hypothetical protein
VLQGPTWASVVDVRVSPDGLCELVKEVRGRVPAGKWAVWRIGPSSEPADLAERLLALGFREPEDRASTLNVVVCVEAPAAAPADIEVRRVETFEDYAASMETMWEAFGTPPHRVEAQRRHQRLTFEAAERAGVPVSFLAYVDGRPAGVGRSVYSEHGVLLISGSVVPWARGRGVYRALVRARWDDAVDRGTPALVTHAVPTTSYPILRRIGFQDVCSVRRLEDPGGN